MANDEHVAILKQGVEVWNKSRDENRDIRPDLGGADLRGANLVGADLRVADLRGARLAGADLGKANLTDVDLSGAYLLGTDLRGAGLRAAKLSGADLRVADLGGARLEEADLMGADLGEANLSEANIHQANFSGVNLRKANLSDANLTWADLSEANLSEANLRNAKLPGAVLCNANTNLRGADLSWIRSNAADIAFLPLDTSRGEPGNRSDVIAHTRASGTRSNVNLSHANLSGANLSGANLSGANLSHANLSAADLSDADLSDANLSEANLQAATLLETDLTGADLTGCRIYGVSAWSLKLEKTKQQNLVITRENEPTVTVDDIEVAQFVYLLLHNEKIRDLIDTIGKKGVLLLGRFTEGRMVVLERLREKLRDLGFVPMVFNFDKPETKDFTDTVRLLASLSKFVIVDITNPRSAPLELQATVPHYMVPFVPILQHGEEPFSMFVDLQNKYDWVLQPVVGYPSVDRPVEVLEEKVVRPAEAKFNELLARRTKLLRVENV